MSDIEERDASDLGQFGALTAEQQAMVNAFAEMVRRGQVPVPSGEPSHIKGDLPLEEGDKRESTQIDDSRERLGDDMETESLRVELQQPGLAKNRDKIDNGAAKSGLVETIKYINEPMTDR